MCTQIVPNALESCLAIASKIEHVYILCDPGIPLLSISAAQLHVTFAQILVPKCLKQHLPESESGNNPNVS